jgi:hypothetical protein
MIIGIGTLGADVVGMIVMLIMPVFPDHDRRRRRSCPDCSLTIPTPAFALQA